MRADGRLAAALLLSLASVSAVRLWQTGPASPGSPHVIFSNDLAGYFKLALAVIAAGSGATGLIGWWIKRGSDRRIDTLATDTQLKIGKVSGDVDGLGRRLTDSEQECKINAAWAAENNLWKSRADNDRKQLGERLRAIEERLAVRDRTDAEHHKEQRELLERISREQLGAVHRVELQVAALQERANYLEHLTTSLDGLGKQLERALDRTSRPGHSHDRSGRVRDEGGS